MDFPLICPLLCWQITSHLSNYIGQAHLLAIYSMGCFLYNFDKSF